MTRVKSYVRAHMFLGMILIAGAFALYFIDEEIRQNELEQRESQLKSVHTNVISHIETSIHNFIAIVSGLRSHIYHLEEFPDEAVMQKYVNDQLVYMEGYDSMAVAYVDTSYVFQYSFNRYQINPSNLKGVSVRDFRDQEEIDYLKKVMQSDQLYLVDPLNLVEGWVGLVMDFGLVKENFPDGFIAVIIDFNSILQRAYNYDLKNEFAFRFRTSKGHDFDRHKVYDGTKCYSDKVDSEYYKKFEIAEDEFNTSVLDLHGLKMEIGTAYKLPYERGLYFTILIYGWYIMLMIYSLVTLRSMISYQKQSEQLNIANNLLQKGNSDLQDKNLEIEEKNVQLNELVNTKNKFFAILSHDLRAPLNSVFGLLTLLKHSQSKDEYEEIIEDLSISTKTTTKLLENVLNWAKLQMNEFPFNPETINIKQMVREALEPLNKAAQKKKIQINVDLDVTATCFGDINMLSTVIRNYVNNAIKFTQVNGTIDVYLVEGDSVVLAVRDNGMGIPGDKLNEIFHLDGSIRHEGTLGEKGTGLGLILCKEFIERHKGKVWVESTLGTGSTFYFSIPKDKPFKVHSSFTH